MAHGYKALGNGTYYGYFKPQFAEFGIDCDMLNWTKTYGKPDHANHKKVFEMLKQGYYFIALMGPGLWTTGATSWSFGGRTARSASMTPPARKMPASTGTSRPLRARCLIIGGLMPGSLTGTAPLSSPGGLYRHSWNRQAPGQRPQGG